MSYGIPFLYIVSKDSELSLYAERYQTGKCFAIGELDRAAEFSENISQDSIIYKKLSNNAATNFM